MSSRTRTRCRFHRTSRSIRRKASPCPWRRCRSPATSTRWSRPSPATGGTSESGSALVVLVVAAPPDARLVAPLGGAVEPLVHAPEAVHSARIGGIGVVDDAVLERERAHAGSLARVRGRVGSRHGRDRDFPLAVALPPRLLPVVLLDARLALLRLGEP